MSLYIVSTSASAFDRRSGSSILPFYTEYADSPQQTLDSVRAVRTIAAGLLMLFASLGLGLWGMGFWVPVLQVSFFMAAALLAATLWWARAYGRRIPIQQLCSWLIAGVSISIGIGGLAVAAWVIDAVVMFVVG